MLSEERFIVERLEELVDKGNCLRRNYACVIAKNSKLYTGYTHSIVGCKHCLRCKLNIPSGERYELCQSIHAEQMALLNAGQNSKGATLYLIGKEKGKIMSYPQPCLICAKLILYAGISKIVTWNGHELKEIPIRDLLIRLEEIQC